GLGGRRSRERGGGLPPRRPRAGHRGGGSGEGRRGDAGGRAGGGGGPADPHRRGGHRRRSRGRRPSGRGPGHARAVGTPRRDAVQVGGGRIRGPGGGPGRRGSSGMMTGALMGSESASPVRLGARARVGRAVRRLRLARPARLPAGVTVVRDVTFSDPTEGGPLRLDLYRPSANGSPRPVVVAVHGGGFSAGSKSWMSRICASLAGEGFVAAAID